MLTKLTKKSDILQIYVDKMRGPNTLLWSQGYNRDSNAGGNERQDVFLLQLA
jgi:hypothetical protein